MPSTRLRTRQERLERQRNHIFEGLAVIVDGLEVVDGGSSNSSESSNSNSSNSISSESTNSSRRIMATINPMNVWSKSGLDLSDSTFAKLYNEATKFRETDDNGDLLKKFKLESERFEELRSLFSLRVNKMASRKIMKVTVAGDDYQLLDQAQLVEESTMIAERDLIWDATKDPKTTDTQDEVNAILDQRIKCHALGTWLQNSLTTDALHKLEHAKSKYMIEKDDEPYIHGPLLWWLIVTEVKPNNDTLVQNAKDRLNDLDVKKFDHSVKDMLTEFDTIAVEISSRLKGSITEDEKISALWKSLETMKEEKFAKIVFDEKQKYRNSTATSKATCDELIRLFKREQTNMEADDIWNKPSPKDQQILTLTSMLQTVVQSVNNTFPGSRPTTVPNAGSQNEGGPFERRSKRAKGVPAWKHENKDNATECDRDGKKWYWCPHHENPNVGINGMWVRHKPSEHKDGFRNNSTNGSEKVKPGTAPSTTSNDPSVVVDNKLFQALKSGADIQVFLNQLATHNTTSLN